MILGGRGPAGLTGPCTCRIALFLYGPQHTLDRLPAGVIFPLRPGTVVDGLGSPSAPLDFLLVAHSGSVVRAPLDGAPQSDEAIIVPSLLGVISPFYLLSDVALDLFMDGDHIIISAHLPLHAAPV